MKLFLASHFLATLLILTVTHRCQFTLAQPTGFWECALEGSLPFQAQKSSCGMHARTHARTQHARTPPLDSELQCSALLEDQFSCA